MSDQNKVKLWFLVAISVIFFALVIGFPFLVFLSFIRGGSMSFGGRNPSFDEPQVTNIGTKNKYECSAICYCDNDEFYRRGGSEKVLGIKRSISLFFTAVSSVLAYKISREHISERCEEELSDTCDQQFIQSEIVECQVFRSEDENCGGAMCSNSECVSTGKDYLDDIRGYNVRKSFPKPSPKTALIVIDMQNSFNWLKDDVMDNVLELIESCYGTGMKIIFTRYGFKSDGSGGKVMKTWWGGLAEYGSSDWMFFDEIQGTIKDKLGHDCHIIDKEGYNSFHDTDLDEYLKMNGIEEVIIVGVTTNCCCASTARAAFDHGYRNYVVSDATAGTSEEQHIEQLKLLSFATSHVISTRQLLDHLKK